jgi:hypothetical protein
VPTRIADTNAPLDSVSSSRQKIVRTLKERKRWCRPRGRSERGLYAPDIPSVNGQAFLRPARKNGSTGNFSDARRLRLGIVGIARRLV